MEAQSVTTNTQSSKNPVTWVPSAYFAMGLPFIVLNMVTVLMFDGLGVEMSMITLWTSLIILPYTLKPLWSPFLELWKTKKFWVVFTQFLSGVVFILVAFSLHLPSFFAVSIALLAIIGFSGATHDIACDGVYMSALTPEKQSAYIGWQGAFYNIAKIAVQGGLVFFVGWLIKRELESGSTSMEANVNSWFKVIFLLGAVMIAISLYHIKALPDSKNNNVGGKKSAKEILHELGIVLSSFFKKKYIYYYIAFIILYRFAEGFVMKIVPLLLKADRSNGGLGLDVETIGVYYGGVGSAAFVLGSILAGYYIKRIGLRKALFRLCICFNLPFVVYTCFAIFQPQESWIVCGGIAIEYFGYGFGFVGLTLFMMQQIAPGQHQMAHYAFASGIMNLGVMLPGMLSGALCVSFEKWFGAPGGFAPFFIFVLVATIPSFLITWFVPFSYDNEGNKITQNAK